MDGFAHKDFVDVERTFRRQVGRTGGGMAVAVHHRGELVVDLWGGHRTDDDPWERDTVAMCFSSTKGVASTALHILADRGLVDYDAPVATYWPEFAANGKQDVTVTHVLTHSAGLHRIRTLIDAAHRMLDWDHMVAALAEAAPAYEPGTRHGYHALTYGYLVGEIVQRVSGMRFADFVDAEIAGPLGCDGLFIGLPERQRHRVAPLDRLGLPRPRVEPFKTVNRVIGEQAGKLMSWAPGPVNPRRLVNALAPRGVEDVLFGSDVMDAAMPSANGFFTARSLSRMYAMLAGFGEVGGVRLLSEDTVGQIARVRSHGPDLVLVVPMDWRLGYHRAFTTRGVPPAAFGHFGFGGSGGWADPSRELAVSMVCNRGSGTPVGDLRIMELGTAAVRSADRRSRRVGAGPAAQAGPAGPSGSAVTGGRA
jgi:CubicO group peptidase (beta-lactamase class C family)